MLQFAVRRQRRKALLKLKRQRRERALLLRQPCAQRARLDLLRFALDACAAQRLGRALHLRDHELRRRRATLRRVRFALGRAPKIALFRERALQIGVPIALALTDLQRFVERALHARRALAGDVRLTPGAFELHEQFDAFALALFGRRGELQRLLGDRHPRRRPVRTPSGLALRRRRTTTPAAAAAPRFRSSPIRLVR